MNWKDFWASIEEDFSEENLAILGDWVLEQGDEKLLETLRYLKRGYYLPWSPTNSSRGKREEEAGVATLYKYGYNWCHTCRQCVPMQMWEKLEGFTLDPNGWGCCRIYPTLEEAVKAVERVL